MFIPFTRTKQAVPAPGSPPTARFDSVAESSLPSSALQALPQSARKMVPPFFVQASRYWARQKCIFICWPDLAAAALRIFAFNQLEATQERLHAAVYGLRCLQSAVPTASGKT
jgi:hypothetical protein